MTFDEYEQAAGVTAIYPGRGEHNPVYPTLGLVGEAGEVAEKVKKWLRDGRPLDDVLYEIGDVLWYAAALAHELGVSLEDIARMNIEKLASRAARNALAGDGDFR